MNKGDLVNEVAKVVGNRGEAQASVDCVFSTITGAMKKKESVSLVGFGTFKVEKRKARKRRRKEAIIHWNGTMDRFEEVLTCPVRSIQIMWMHL